MFEVIIPKLGLTMEAGTIEKWRKKEGDEVKEGDILFDLMTDKVSLEVESYYSGILRKILHFEGEEIPVTEVVAYIGSKDEPLPVLKKFDSKSNINEGNFSSEPIDFEKKDIKSDSMANNNINDCNLEKLLEEKYGI